MICVAFSLVTKSAIPMILPPVLLVAIWVRRRRETSLQRRHTALGRRLGKFKDQFEDAGQDLFYARARVHVLCEPPDAETEGERSLAVRNTALSLILPFDALVEEQKREIERKQRACQKMIDRWRVKTGEKSLNEIERILKDLDGLLKVFRDLESHIGPKAQASAVNAYQAAVLPSRNELVRRVQECRDAVEKLKTDGANISEDFSALLEGAVATFDGHMTKKRDWPAASIRVAGLLSNLDVLLSLHQSMHDEFGVRRYEIANATADLKNNVARFKMWKRDGYPYSPVTHAIMLDFTERLDALRGMLESEQGNPRDHRKTLEKLVHEMCAYVTTEEAKHREWLVGEFRKNGDAFRSKLSQLLIPVENVLRTVRRDLMINPRSFMTADANVIRSMVAAVEKIRAFYQVDLVMALSIMSTMDDRDVALVAERCAESIVRLEEFRDVTDLLIKGRGTHATASFPAVGSRGTQSGTLN